MTLQQLYRKAEEKLFVDNALFEAKQLVMFVCGCGSNDFLLKRNNAATAEQINKVFALCERRNSGTPLYYLTGECEFYGLPFKVGRGVLIPRADTEVLVDVALSLIKNINSPKIADLCAGSGCVGIAIAKNRPDAQVYAVELFDEAFGFLQQNIKLNNAENVVPQKADALKFAGDFNLVVSNPPYISFTEKSGLQKEVLNEPHTALFADENGYAFYKKIAENFKTVKHLSLCFEVGEKMDSETANIMEKSGYKNIRLTKDLCGINRVVSGETAN